MVPDFYAGTVRNANIAVRCYTPDARSKTIHYVIYRDKFRPLDESSYDGNFRRQRIGEDRRKGGTRWGQVAADHEDLECRLPAVTEVGGVVTKFPCSGFESRITRGA